MKWFPNRAPGRAAATLTGLSLLAGMSLPAVFVATASAQPPATAHPAHLTRAARPAPTPPIPGPAPGVAPGLVIADWESPPGPGPDLLYLATTGVVWIRQQLETINMGGPPTLYGGRLVSAPAPIFDDRTDTQILFGQGTDNQLWSSGMGGYTMSIQPWHPLGGRLTAAPAAVSLGGGAYAVFVRGADGALWERAYSGTAWSSWRSLGGRLLAGTGPAAAYLTASRQVYVAVVGTDRRLYLTIVGQRTGFFSIGGQMTVNPALTAISPSTLAAFARGTNGSGYYNQYRQAGGAAGWRSIGGRLTSGLAAATSIGGGSVTTYTMALGADSQVYETKGNWAQDPPKFSGWTKVTGPPYLP
jgi:hypothetical protein